MKRRQDEVVEQESGFHSDVAPKIEEQALEGIYANILQASRGKAEPKAK